MISNSLGEAEKSYKLQMHSIYLVVVKFTFQKNYFIEYKITI